MRPIILSIVPLEEGKIVQFFLSEKGRFYNPQVLERKGELVYLYDEQILGTGNNSYKSYGERLAVAPLSEKRKEVLQSIYAKAADDFVLRKARLDKKGSVVVAFQDASAYFTNTDKGKEMKTQRVGLIHFEFDKNNYKGYYDCRISTELWARSAKFHPSIDRYKKHLMKPRTGPHIYNSAPSRKVPYKILPNGDFMLFQKFAYDRMHFRVAHQDTERLTEYEAYTTDHSGYIVLDAESLRPKYFDIVDTINKDKTWDSSKGSLSEDRVRSPRVFVIQDGLLIQDKLILLNGQQEYGKAKGKGSILISDIDKDSY